VAINSIFLPMTEISMMSPLVMTRPSMYLCRYASAPVMRRGTVGAKTTDSAGAAWISLTGTLSSMLTPALRRVLPSRRTTPVLVSSG